MPFPPSSVVPPVGQVSGGVNALPVEYMFSQIMAAVQKSVSLIFEWRRGGGG
jgi:mannose-1-phosphate guanylyltransferase